MFEFADVDPWTLTWVFDSLGKALVSIREFLIEEKGVEKADDVLPKWRVDEIVSASGEARAAARDDDDSTFADLDDPDGDPKPQSQTKGKESSAMSVKDKQDAAKQEAAFQEREGELSAREQKLQEQEAAFAEQQRRTDAAQFIDGLVSGGRLPPGHRDGLVAFMASLDGEDTIEFGEGDDAKTETPVQFLKTFLEGLGKTIEFAEVSGAGDDEEGSAGDFTAPAGYAVDPDKAKINAAALAYQEKHDCDFSTAVTAVTRKAWNPNHGKPQPSR